MANKSNLTLPDQLGELQAQIAELQAAERKLKDTIIEDLGEGTHEGDWYNVNVAHSVRKTVGWKAIAEKLGASPQMIAGNTKEQELTTVRCTARKAVRK